MYNRYIPNGTAYTRVVEEDAPPFHHPEPPPGPQRQPEPEGFHEEPPHARQEPQAGPRPAQSQPRQNQQPPPIWGAASGGAKPTWLSGLLKNFKLEDFDLDTGDILLLLIILFILIDGDDIELVITLGLLLLFSLGGKKKDKEDS